MTDDNQSQSATETFDRNEFGVLASKNGSLFFDVLLPASLPIGPKRYHIRDCFKEVVQDLTNVVDKDQLKKLARFMYYEMTREVAMPSGASDMLDKLNKEYILDINSYCFDMGARPKIGAYKASQDTSVSDLYCIGADGLRYCYHFFELAGTDPILLPEGAKFRMCCVASFE